MTSVRPVVLEIDAPIARIWINRAEKANALDRNALDHLADALGAVAAQEETRLLILSGTGERAFCAGLDLNELSENTANSGAALRLDARWDAVSDQIAALPCLTIAYLNGACVGGGLSLALACDLRLSVASAFLAYPAIRHGVIPSPRDVTRLTGLVGPNNGKRILMLGGRLSASKAREIGLVDEVGSADTLNRLVGEFGNAIGANRRANLVAIKRLIDRFPESRRTAQDCYEAVYDGSSAALERLLSPVPPVPDDTIIDKMPTPSPCG